VALRADGKRFLAAAGADAALAPVITIAIGLRRQKVSQLTSGVRCILLVDHMEGNLPPNASSCQGARPARHLAAPSGTADAGCGPGKCSATSKAARMLHELLLKELLASGASSCEEGMQQDLYHRWAQLRAPLDHPAAEIAELRVHLQDLGRHPHERARADKPSQECLVVLELFIFVPEHWLQGDELTDGQTKAPYIKVPRHIQILLFPEDACRKLRGAVVAWPVVTMPSMSMSFQRPDGKRMTLDGFRSQ